MKSWIILSAVAIGLTAVFTVALPLLTADSSSVPPGFPAPTGTEGPTGAVEVDGDLAHQFGVMAQDSDGIHSWVFKNTGHGPLELRNLGTDCSCTIAQLGKPAATGETAPSKLEVPPGSSEKIDVKWNTKKGDGPYRKTARIGTNDPKRPEITLQVEGTVRPAITMIPPDGSINYGTISNDESYKKTLYLYSADRPDLKLTSVISSNPTMLDVATRPLNEEELKGLKVEKGYAFDVTLKMVPTLGAFAEEILVQTDHPMKKEFRINVLGRLTGPITLTPDRVVLREISSSNGGSEDLTIWVRGRSSAEFHVQKKPESLDVNIEKVAQPADSKGSKYKLTIKVIPGTSPGKIQDEILLKTDHPQASELKVPVDIIVQGSN